MINVLLVDDHAIVREGFKRLMEREGDLIVVAEVATEASALAAVLAHSPDLLVTDLSLAQGSGIGLLKAAMALPNPPIAVVLSMHDGLAFVAEAMSLGAKGYVTKASGAEELVCCIREVLGGGSYLSPSLKSGTGKFCIDAVQITPRELETLRLLARGLVPKAAAAELGISEKTLYSHRASLFDKLGARNDRELAVAAIEKGLM